MELKIWVNHSRLLVDFQCCNILQFSDKQISQSNSDNLEFEPGTVRWKVKTNPLVFRYFEVQIITNKIIFKLQTIELATPRPSSPAPTANAFRSCGAATSTTTAATTPTSRPTSAETRTVLLDGEDVQVTLSPLAHHYS